MSNLENSVSYKNNQFYIASTPVMDLIEKYKTPFYVYDGNFMLEKYNGLYSLIPWPKLHIYYAVKANHNVSLLKLLLKNNAFLDTVSPAEVYIALKLGFAPEKIIFTANNMTDEEMHEVSKYNIIFNIDSLTRLEKYGTAYPGSNVCIRFNPDVAAGENIRVQTAGNLTKFGILLDQVPDVKKIVEKHKLKVVGLHEHTGSGISNTEKVYESMTNLLGIARKEDFPDLEFISFGGGFKVCYQPAEHKIDYVQFGKKIAEIFSEFSQRYGRELYMNFEPGKYTVAECGYFIMQVNTLKNNRDRLIAGTNSGFPQLIRPVFYNAYHHIINLSNPHGKIQTYDICGNICETGDHFAKQRAINEIREGDYLLIFNAGAYCYSMGGIYNVRPMPSEIIIYNGEVMLSRQAQTNLQLADYILQENKCSI